MTMKYIARAIKYFFYYTIILAVIMAALVLFDLVEADPAVMFRQGWKSIGEILLLFGTVAAIYPKFGFTRRTADVPGEYSQVRQGVIDYMENRGYRLENEDGLGTMTFRLRSKASAVTRMLEDRITMTHNLEGFEIEGLTKDVVRIVGGLEYKFRVEDNGEAVDEQQ